LERERLKEGLRVWLERKARNIKAKKRDGAGVGVLVWRFSKRLKPSNAADDQRTFGIDQGPRKENVGSLKRFWEGMNNK
jgi:hypothetical protein